MRLIKKIYPFLTWQTVTIVVLVIALLITIALLIQDSIELQHAGAIRSLWHPLQLPKKISIDAIQPWMTFDYINKQFGLSPDYFASTLGIDDPSYPNLTMAKLFRKRGLDPQTGAEQVKQLVRDKK